MGETEETLWRRHMVAAHRLPLAPFWPAQEVRSRHRHEHGHPGTQWGKAHGPNYYGYNEDGLRLVLRNHAMAMEDGLEWLDSAWDALGYRDMAEQPLTPQDSLTAVPDRVSGVMRLSEVLRAVADAVRVTDAAIPATSSHRVDLRAAVLPAVFAELLRRDYEDDL